MMIAEKCEVPATQDLQLDIEGISDSAIDQGKILLLIVLLI